MSVLIRPARAEDWPAVGGLCADTGAQGEPIEGGHAEREEFAKRWVGPYKVLCPEWTFVAEVDGKVVGYLTACPDTLVFERRVREELQPTPDSRGFFGEKFLNDFWTANPGHLHMNVSKAHRSAGLGRKLLDLCFSEMKRVGLKSAHVFCGNRAKGYWEKAGFTLERSCEPRPGVFIHALVHPL